MICQTCWRPWPEHTLVEARVCEAELPVDDSVLPTPIREGVDLAEALRFGVRWRAFGYQLGGGAS